MRSAIKLDLIDFVARGGPAFALIDGANCSALSQVTALEGEAASLYRRSIAIPQELAPWLVPVATESTVEILSVLPPDSHWGVLFHSDAPFVDLQAHFRRFTMVTLPGGSAPSYFRFYDPRVFTDALTALSPWRAAELCKPMNSLAVPASPVLNMSTDPLAPRSSFRGKVFELAKPTQSEKTAGQRLQYLAQGEKAALDKLNYRRSGLRLARELQRAYPTASHDLIIYAAKMALRLGKAHALTTVKELRVLGDCLIAYSGKFPTSFPEAQRILDGRPTERWQKGVWLREWLDLTGAQTNVSQKAMS